MPQSAGKPIAKGPALDSTSLGVLRSTDLSVLESAHSFYFIELERLSPILFSDREVVLLPQAFVKQGFGNEAAQETDLTCHFPSGVASLGHRCGRCL